MANEKRLIDANTTADAIAEVMDKYDGYDSCQNKIIQGLMKAQDVVADAPTIDAVPVVRCKDCKCNGACSIQDAMNWTPRTEIGDSFCSYGERKDNGTAQV